MRFQRTPPSRESSRMIPLSASWSRMRSDAAKSRRFRAACRSATRASISASLGADGCLADAERAEFLRVVVAQHRENRVEHFQYGSSTGAASPWRNSPRSIAVFTSRTRSKIAASACAVFRSSARPRVEIFPRFRGALRHRRRNSLPEISPDAQARDKISQPLHRTRRALQTLRREIQLAAVRHRGQQKPDRRRLVPVGKQFAQRREIPQRLRHFFVIHQQVLGMEPVARERLSGGRFGFRDFIFVMRESQIDAAAVNVQRVAQIFHGHGGAFDVPAGASRADRRLPEMFAGLGRFPQGEVARVVLVVAIHVHARAGLHAAHVDFRKLAVRRKFRDAEIGRAFAGVRESLFGEPLDQRSPCRRYARWRARCARAARGLSARRSSRYA